MHKIMGIYDEVDNYEYQDTLLDFFNRYSNESIDEKSYKFFVNEISLREEISTYAVNINYNREGAATWAINNANTFNSKYPKLTLNDFSDCTNFVSQAMHEGGKMAMSRSWYCEKKNTTYWQPANVSQLNYSWSLSDPSPWTAVRTFDSFWSSSSRSTSYLYSSLEYVQNHRTIYNKNILKGDVVLLKRGLNAGLSIPTHAMIISDYDSVNKDFLLAGHSNSRQKHPLLTAIRDYQAVEIIHIKDTTGYWQGGDSAWYWYEYSAPIKLSWRYIGGYWYYFKNNGVMARYWQYIDGVWYYFNYNGDMKKGWLYDNDGYWYYLDATNGDMKTGWKYINNVWYYFYSSGRMATNTVIDGWRIDSSGAATKI